MRLERGLPCAIILGSAYWGSSPSNLQIHVRLPAVAFFDESDVTEHPQSPEEMANVPHGDGAWAGPVDQFDQRPGRKEAPFVLKCLLKDFHYGLPPLPVHFSRDAICGHPDWGSLAWFGLGSRAASGGGCPPQLVNGVDSAPPFGSACSQLCVPLLFKQYPALS